MLPSSIDSEMSRRPSVWPLRASRSSRLMPLRAASSQRCGRGPNILYMLLTSILAISGFLALMLVASAQRLRDAVEHDGQDHDAQPCQQPAADLQAVDALQHLVTQAAHPDHRGNDDHGKRHHGGLVD